MSASEIKGLLSRELVQLGASPKNKSEAIEQAAALLIAGGYVEPGYARSMAEREKAADTYLGQGVAIPHGQASDRNMVKKNGIAIVQVPAGVTWSDGQIAHLVVGIAAQSDSHIAVLRRLTRLLQDTEQLKKLFSTANANDIVFTLQDEQAPAEDAAPAEDFDTKITWTVAYPNGLHARPSTSWVNTAKRFKSAIKIRHNNETADAKALVGLLQLGLKKDDTITISASGPDADEALAAIKATADSLVEKEADDAKRAAEAAAKPVVGWQPPGHPTAKTGVSAAPGLAIGQLRILGGAEIDVQDTPTSLVDGGAKIDEALTATRAQLKALADDTARRVGASESGIFKAQNELLNDTDLITRACQLMVEGHGAAWSWHTAVEQTADTLAANGNPVLAGRAADLRDVGRRVLRLLDPTQQQTSLSDLEDGANIIVAEDLSPSDTASLSEDKIAGLVTAQGGPTSHTAILARTRGFPAVVAAGSSVLKLEDGATAIIDGTSGRLYLNPSEEDLKAAQSWIDKEIAIKEKESAARALPAKTTDGHSIDVTANINQAHQAPFALEQGAEGCGLMRTEFLFLESDHTPDEDEQFEAYCAMLIAMEGKPVIVRTLDIGGDKQVAHLDLPHEMNPFLGVRGTRLLLRRPELMVPQLRALYRAAKERPGQLNIMFPMITSLTEVQRIRAISEQIREELEAPTVPIGIMIEVPAAAIKAAALAPHVDFFSIGTNDLTQYTLAIDRQNPDLAPEADAMHPAVLALIHRTVEGAKAAGRWVGVCGGLAGDPFGAQILAGLGVTELSMTPREIPSVKARLRQANLSDLQKLAERALKAETAADVRALEVSDHA